MTERYRLAGRSATEILASLEAAVRDGGLVAGDLVPTVRALATELGVAPGTVASAYKTAVARGLLETRGRLGTRVRARPALATRSTGPAVPEGVVDLASGQPSAALLPRLEAVAVPGGPAAAPGDLVLPALAELGRARLVADGVDATHLTVAGGGLDAIRRVLLARLAPGDAVAVEDPGWPNLLDLLAASGLRALPVRVDDAGPDPRALAGALAEGARAVVVTARAQNPTGARVTPERAARLRTVLAAHPDVLLVEDDHAAELARVPLASLAGVTAAWASVRSLSKPYGPDLRLALVAGDEATVARVEGQLRVGSGWVSTLLQHVAVALWSDPDVARVVATAADTYDERRTALLHALEAAGLPGSGATGLNVWVPVPDEARAVAGLLAAGWAVAPGQRFRQQAGPAVRVTVGDLDPGSAEDLAAALRQAVEGASGGPVTA
ncbi:aminotransferase class I/II-fold pyridoxal phosphate-dependent enzyme [Microlunatus flavus]|uniref:aminotransferase class I/II-fold pyridoxal phosphate-dependent enzyme n=1 Tax=Microlunatus flavus TaxID=1036181 RepID=UPI000B831890|nr:aminotransferase class I/II-fold pyridoxal phosphate-dependent enzyme [Microlunatus flavus]